MRRISGAAAALAAVLGAAFLIPGAPPAAAADPGDFDTVLAAMEAELTGGDFDPLDPRFDAALARIDTAAEDAWSALDTDVDRTYLWSDITPTSSGAGSEYIATNYLRIETLARAVSTPGSLYFQNASLRSDAVEALQWMYDTWYNPGITASDNWFPWELGGPLPLINSVIMLRDHLASSDVSAWMAAVAHFNPTISHGASTNRAWDARIFIARGALTGDEGVLTTGSNAVLAMLNTQATLGQNGYFADGSFIDHNYFPYTTGYGLSWFSGVVRMLQWLQGTPWTITDPRVANVATWAFESYVPVIHRGVINPSLAGRNIARGQDLDHVTGVAAMEALIQLSSTLGAVEQLSLRRHLKGWILSAVPQSDFYERASVFAIAEALTFIDDPAITAWPSSSSVAVYPVMDRVAMARPDFQFTLAMHSNRVKNYEMINGENRRAWHTADGMYYLYSGDDLDQFSNHYWPTVDPYRLPGTTVQANTNVASGLSTSSFVGGVDLDGLSGSATMMLAPPGNTLHANKSWFLFDEEIVALGSNIDDSSGKQVETIVDNRRLSGAAGNALVVDGVAVPNGADWASTFSDVEWMNLAGSTPGSGVGYVFPGSASVAGERDTRSGTWATLNSLSPYNDTTPRSNTFNTFWLGHGANPSDASYEYILLPASSPAETSAYAADNPVTILANTPTVHAAAHDDGTVAANFFAATGGSVSVDATTVLTSTTPGSVMLKRDGTGWDVAVSSPSFDQTSVRIELAGEPWTLVSEDAAVTAVGGSAVQIDVAGARGASFHFRLEDGTAATAELRDPLDDWSLSASHSAGMTFGVLNADLYFEGDASRAIRSGSNTAQSIVYEFDGAVSAEAVVFSAGALSASQFQVATSVDGTTWQPASVVIPPGTATGGIWRRTNPTTSGVFPAGTQWVRFTLANDTRIYAPALGEVSISATVP
ncbi:polysaccharide lyase 8 family protein [Microbacterium sp. NPDC055903]